VLNNNNSKDFNSQGTMMITIECIDNLASIREGLVHSKIGFNSLRIFKIKIVK